MPSTTMRPFSSSLKPQRSKSRWLRPPFDRPPRVNGTDPPLHSDRIGVTEVVCYFVFEEGDEIARDGMSNPHDQGILRLVDKLVDPLWLSRTGKGDSPAVNIAPPRNFDFGISPMLPHGKDAVCRVGAIRFIRQVDRRRG